MNDTAKLAVGVGTGMVLGKLTGGSSAFWWLVGAAAALFVVNSPTTKGYISSGAKRAAAKVVR